MGDKFITISEKQAKKIMGFLDKYKDLGYIGSKDYSTNQIGKDIRRLLKILEKEDNKNG